LNFSVTLTDQGGNHEDFENCYSGSAGKKPAGKRRRAGECSIATSCGGGRLNEAEANVKTAADSQSQQVIKLS
jgi:hypothetical protein